MLTDSHTHLNSPQLFPKRQQHLQYFVDTWGVWLSIIGTNLEDSKQAIQIVAQARQAFPDLQIGATIGIHPEYAWLIDIHHQVQTLDNLYCQHKDLIIWIGEIGTDLYREQYRPYHTQQKELFHLQCKLADKYNLPIVIHSRADFEGSLETVKQFEGLKIYFHCRGYTSKELSILQAELKTRGSRFFVGFCGNVSYPKAQELRDSLQYCLEHHIDIVLETDAPYLAPQIIRWQQNTPAHIIHTYQYISEYFHIDIDTLKQDTHDNFVDLYFPITKTIKKTTTT